MHTPHSFLVTERWPRYWNACFRCISDGNKWQILYAPNAFIDANTGIYLLMSPCNMCISFGSSLDCHWSRVGVWIAEIEKQLRKVIYLFHVCWSNRSRNGYKNKLQQNKRHYLVLSPQQKKQWVKAPMLTIWQEHQLAAVCWLLQLVMGLFQGVKNRGIVAREVISFL